MLSPAEDAEGDGEGEDEPSQENCNGREHLGETLALEHVSAHGVDSGSERKRADEGLNYGWEAGGGEKYSGQYPHGEHDQVHEAGDGFHGAGAGGYEKAKGGKGERCEDAEDCQLPERAAEGDDEDEAGESEKHDDFDNQHGQAGEQEGRKVLPAGHGRGDEALEQLFLAGLDDGKAEAPHGRAHEVHAEEAGDYEVDVAGAGFVDELVGGREGVAAAGCGLDGLVREETGSAGVRIGVVVAVFDAGGALDGEEEDDAGCEGVMAGGFSEGLGAEAGVAGEGLGKLRGGGGYGKHVGGAVAEGDAEADGEKDGKMKIQKMASGSRRMRRKRMEVSW